MSADPRGPKGWRSLRTDGLVKEYKGRRVVGGVSIEVGRGEVVGLLGPNGAGKTTTFYMIVGMIRPNAGRIYLDAEDVTARPMYQRARMGIGYLSQESSIFRKLTVEENLLAILETLPLSKAERRRKAEGLMEELGIASLARSRAYTLSGGERRRAEISRALTTDPAFLLLDEPFAGIDPIAVQDVQEIVASLRDRGIGVLITDHNVRETLSITNRAYILYEGKVLLSGSAKELADNPEAREIYLGERFRL
ncbi:MAG: LPS export ABC transporter ATP-binding protein [Candidatus Eisenbacteria bacterium]|nr:LPS export ABC transporter ATP-binding protein [Candidatus Eisenbacteria bacterium]